MDAADGEVKRIEAGKNALESFVYENREKLSSDENVIQVSTEEVREAIVANMTAMEEWLYEEEAMLASAEVLEGKLAELQEQVNPILRRAWELEQRPLLPEVVEKVRSYVNNTLEFVKLNMTWVAAHELEGVANLSSAFDSWWEGALANQSNTALTEDPAYSVNDAKRLLHRMQTEAQRLTKIRKIDPVPYSDYGKGYGGSGGYGGYDDPKMRAYYEQMYKNNSRNGSASDMFGNFSNFPGWKDSEYMKSYYEHMARNFSANSTGSEESTGGKDDTGGGAQPGDHTEL